MTREEIKEKFRNSKKWEFDYLVVEGKVYRFKHMPNLSVVIWDDGSLTINIRCPYFLMFGSQSIPAALFQIREKDDGTEMYIKSTNSAYCLTSQYLSLYL